METNAPVLIGLMLVPIVLGVGLNPFLATGFQATDDGSSSLDACSGSLAPSDLQDCLDQVLNEFDASDPFGAVNILVAVTSIIEVIEGYINSIAAQFPVTIKTGVGEITFGESVGSTLNTIGSTLTDIVGALESVVDTVIDLAQLPGEIINYIGELLYDLANGFFESLIGIIDSVREFFVGIGDGITNGIDRIVDAFNEQVNNQT